MTSLEPKATWRLAEELLEVAKADTLFADLFLQRARDLLSSELTSTQWARLSDVDAEVANVTNHIATAMDAGDWKQVRDLTGRATELKRSIAERAPLRSVATRVYGFDEVLVDPFSPGLATLAGVPERDLPALRDGAVKRLERLRTADPSWGDLYEARRKALAALQLGGAMAAVDETKHASAAALRARAQKALVEGDLTQLQQLSAQLLEAEQRTGKQTAAAEGETAWRPPDLAHPFARDVQDHAAKLGLAPHRVPSMAQEVMAKFQPSWRPALLAEGGGSTIRLSVSVPSDAPEALRDKLAMYVNRVFVTSAGTRFMPWFVEEDVLVEDFDEPAAGVRAAPTALVEALGLPARNGLSRRKIEQAVRERGAAIVRDLGLDPLTYRIACIPIDVFTRLGDGRGWGKQEIWTHFDGYMASNDRKLMALVGGDARFGGIHDLVAVDANYDSERLVARFAVVQRRRFATW